MHNHDQNHSNTTKQDIKIASYSARRPHAATFLEMEDNRVPTQDAYLERLAAPNELLEFQAAGDHVKVDHRCSWVINYESHPNK